MTGIGGRVAASSLKSRIYLPSLHGKALRRPSIASSTSFSVEQATQPASKCLAFARSFHNSSLKKVSQSSSGIREELVFPGALKSKFTNVLKFDVPSSHEAMDTYRLVDIDGVQVDNTVEIDVDQELALRLYKEMITVNIMDAIMYDAQRQGRLSFYMVSAGEEGSAVGSASALKKEDMLFAQYRETGALLHRGMTLDQFMSQFYSNKNDEGRGRNMPVHHQSKEFNIQPISSTLATQIPHASGAAYAVKMLGGDRCVICYFGEGAASEGDFHAALNIAATRNCPVIFFCRNNGFAISTPSLEQYKGDGIASRGVGYGIDTIRVDGNDIFAVRRATQQAREMAVRDKKPILIEAMSYRVSHHSTSDDSFAYRSKTEVDDWKRRDNPISRMRKWMEAKGWWSEAQETQCRTELRREILKSFAAAEKFKKPALRYLFEDTFDVLPENLQKQKEQLEEILDTYPENYDLSHFDEGRKGLD